MILGPHLDRYLKIVEHRTGWRIVGGVSEGNHDMVICGGMTMVEAEEGLKRLSDVTLSFAQQSLVVENSRCVDKQLDSANLLLGRISGTTQLVAEEIHRMNTGQNKRHGEWQDTIERLCKGMTKNQKYGLIFTVFIMVVVSVLTNLLMS